MKKITPFLWFNDKAEEAAKFYASLFKNSKVLSVSRRCGWLTDKYGLSWQIDPDTLGQLLRSKDPAKAARVMQAMLAMDKLDIRKLKQAAAARA